MLRLRMPSKNANVDLERATSTTPASLDQDCIAQHNTVEPYCLNRDPSHTDATSATADELASDIQPDGPNSNISPAAASCLDSDTLPANRPRGDSSNIPPATVNRIDSGITNGLDGGVPLAAIPTNHQRQEHMRLPAPPPTPAHDSEVGRQNAFDASITDGAFDFDMNAQWAEPSDSAQSASAASAGRAGRLSTSATEALRAFGEDCRLRIISKGRSLGLTDERLILQKSGWANPFAPSARKTNCWNAFQKAWPGGPDDPRK